MTPAAITTGEGRGIRPSPRWGTAIALTVLAALLGLFLGRFLTYTDTPTVPLPTVVVPPDDDVRALTAAADAAPENPVAWQALGIAATSHAIATADPAWYEVAGDALDRAAQLDPADTTTTIAQGQLALSLHDFERALAIGEEVTARAPDTAAAWGVLVDAQVELGAYEDAATSLQAMLDLNPDLPALARASYLRQLNGDLEGAIVAMRQALLAGGIAPGGEVTDSGGVVSALLGDLLLHRGDIEGAREAYAATSTPAGAAGLARIAASEGDLATAERILTDLVDRTPAPPAILALAEVQHRAGDADALADTVELARTVATLQQAAGQTVDLELALFEASFGDPGRAVELAEQAHAARPDNVFTAGALAWSLHRTGDTERARALAAQASRLGTVDTAHELRMASITGEGRDELLARNPLAEELFVP